jgi:hypothetical protein
MDGIRIVLFGFGFKRDHKSQKRIQCGINQKDFFKLKINFNNIIVQ